MTARNTRTRRLLLPLITVALILPFFKGGESVDAQEESPQNYGLYIQVSYERGTRADVGVGEARPPRASLPPTDPAAGLSEDTGHEFEFSVICLGLGADCAATPPDTVTWDFGDGGTAVTTGNQTVKHAYKEPGVYLVRAIAEDTDSPWFGEATRQVYVSPHFADIGSPETYQSIIRADNPRMFWSLNNKFTDDTDGENNFSNPGNGVTFSPDSPLADPSNISAHFASEEAYLQVNEIDGMPSAALTFEAWVKAAGGQEGTIVSYAVEAGTDIDDFAVRNPSNLEVVISNVAVVTGVDIANGEWHHLVVTWTTTDGAVQVWVDGRLEFIDDEVAIGASIPDGGSLVLGAEQDGNSTIQTGGGAGFVGHIDEVAIYDRVLQSPDIIRHHEKGTAERSVVYRPDREAIWATSALELFDVCRTAEGIDDTAVGREVGRGLFCPEPEKPTTLTLPIPFKDPETNQIISPDSNGITGDNCLDSPQACNLPKQYFGEDGADTEALIADGFITSEGALIYNPLNCGDGWAAVKERDGSWVAKPGTEDGCLTRGDWYNALINAVDGLAAINLDLADSRLSAGPNACEGNIEAHRYGDSFLRAMGLGIAEPINENCHIDLAVSKQEAYVSLNRVLGGRADGGCPATFKDLIGDPNCAAISSAIDRGAPIVGNIGCGEEVGVCFNPYEPLNRVDGATLLAGLIVREVPTINSMQLNVWVNIDPTQVPVNMPFTVYAEVDVPLTYIGSVTIDWPQQALEAGINLEMLCETDKVTFTHDQLRMFGSYKRTPTATCDYMIQSDKPATLAISATNDIEQEVTENLQITGVNTPPEQPKPEDVNHVPNLDEGYGDGDGGYNADTQTFYSSDVNKQAITFQITGDTPSGDTGVRARTTGATIGNYPNTVTLGGPTGWWRLNADTVRAAYNIYNVSSKFPQQNTDYHPQNKAEMDSFFGGAGTFRIGGGTWTGPLKFRGDLPKHPGTYGGTPTRGGEGVAGSRTVSFSGDDSIQIANHANLQITGDLTYEMWLRPTDLSVRRNPINKAYGGEGTITQETSGKLNFYHGSSGTNATPYQAFPTSGSLTQGEWNHVVVTREGNTVRWYINGELDSVHTSTTPPSASTAPLIIGSGYTNGYVGGIDEVAVYNRALTAAEIYEHYTLGQDVNPTAYSQAVQNSMPVGYWRLEETSGTEATDSSPAAFGKPAGAPADYYSLNITGSIYIPETGTYTFAMDVDDNGDIIIDGQVVVSRYGGGGMRGDPANNAGQKHLTAGWHSFEARMVEGWGQDGLHIQWKKPGSDEFEDLTGAQLGTPLVDSAEGASNPARLSGAGFTLGPNNSGLVAGSTRSIDLGGGRAGAAHATGSLWALWAFDGDYSDSTPAGRDLWFSGNPQFIGGDREGEEVIGIEGRRALRFDTAPTRGYLQTAEFPTSAVTVEGFFRVAPASPTEATIFSYASGSTPDSFTLTTPSNLTLYVAGQSTGGTGADISDGEWHHVAATWTSEGGHYAIYVDGKVVSTGTVASGSAIGANGVFVIGDDQDSLGGGFDPEQAFLGDMLDLAVYDAALPAGTIKDIAERGIVGEAAIDIPDSATVNDVYTKEKSVEAWIRTGGDVTRPQGIWVEGDEHRGIAVYVAEERIWYGAWNRPADGIDGSWGPRYVSAEIEPNTTYLVSFSLSDNEFAAYLNGVEVGEFAAGGLYPHPTARIGGSVRPFPSHDGTEMMVWGFGGRIDEVAHYLKPIDAAGMIQRYEHGSGKVIVYDDNTGAPVAAVYGTAAAASQTVEDRYTTSISVHPITPDSNGTFTYHIRACDIGGACSSWVQRTGEVKPEGDAPRGTTQSAFVAETIEGGSPVVFNLSANDDADDGWAGHESEIIRYRIVKGPSRGILQYDNDPGDGVNWTDYVSGVREIEGNSLRYIPYDPPQGDGYIAIQYQALDAGYDADTATGLWSPVRTAWIRVENVNQAPICYTTAGEVTEDTPKSLSLSKPANLQAGCWDMDGDALSYEIVSHPKHGTVVVSGSVAVYSPVANYCGTDQFTFRATDGRLWSNSASYQINVVCVNDTPTPPTVGTGGSTTIAAFNEDSAGRTVTIYTTDPDYQIMNGVTAPPQSWTFQVRGTSDASWSNTSSSTNSKVTVSVNQGSLDNLNASLTVTPKANQCGPYTVYVRVTDGLSTSAQQALTGEITCINDAPEAPTPNTMPTVAEDGPNAVRDFTWTDVDDPQPGPAQTHRLHIGTSSGTGAMGTSNITVNLSVQGSATVSVANINGNSPGGRVTVNPGNNACGNYTFYVRAHDGHTYSGATTVTGSVTCVNDAPTAPTTNMASSVNEDHTLSGTWTTTDVDAQDANNSRRWWAQVRVRVRAGDSGNWPSWPSSWSGSNTNNETVNINLGSNAGRVTLAQGSTQTNKNASVTYTPGQNYAGSIQIAVRFCDNGVPGDTASRCSAATVHEIDVVGWRNQITAINTTNNRHRWHIARQTSNPANASGAGWWATWDFGAVPASQDPVKGDWDGDGWDEYGLVYRGGCESTPSQPRWHTNMRRDGSADESAASAICFGLNTDLSYWTGDWNGDGDDDLAVYRPTAAGSCSSGPSVYKRDRQTGSVTQFCIGLGSTAGNISGSGGQRTTNGGGADDMFLYRSSDANWWIRTATGGSIASFAFGNACTPPRCSFALVGGWTTNGVDYIGMYRASDGSTRLRNAHNAGGTSYTATNGVGWEGAVVVDNPK